MTDAFVGWLIIGGLVVLSMLFKRRKPPSIPLPTIYEGTGRFELFEIVRPVVFTPKRRSNKLGWFVFIAVVVIVIVALNH